MPKYKRVPKKKRRNENFENAAFQTEIRGPRPVRQSRLPYLLFLSGILVEFESMTDNFFPVNNSECRI